MNPEKYQKALKAVAKYSRLLSNEEVRPFLDAHYNGDNQAMGVLKDKFQDEGDPRGDIWDRAEGLTKPDRPVKVGTVASATKVTLGNLETTGDQHNITFFADGQGVEVSHTHYLVNDPDSITEQVKNTSRWGNFTPEEARTLADKFPDEHAEQIHQFLDTHFPHTKRSES